MRRSAALLATAVLAGALTACAQGGSTRCGPDVRERLDPASTQHLLPGAPEPRYLTDPPTSGPHAVGTLPRGVGDRPIPRPVQVAILEAGGVLIQYRDLSGTELKRLRSLAGGDVRVAPAPRLRARVVATAWTHKLSCSGVDTAALRRFIAVHAGKGA